MELQIKSDHDTRSNGTPRERHAEVGDMTLEQIELAVEINGANIRRESEEAERAETSRLEKEETERQERAAFTAELALALGVGLDELDAEARRRRPDGILPGIVWERAFRAPHYTRAEERVCLAAAGLLPAVKKSDPAFGRIAIADVRALPEFESDRLVNEVARADGRAYFEWATRNGQVPAKPKIAHEDRAAFTSRIEMECRQRLFDRHDARRNQAMADRALELTAGRLAAATRDRDREHAIKIVERRGELVAGVDAVLTKLDPGIAYWWLREARRHLAGEAPKIVAVGPSMSGVGNSWAWMQLRPHGYVNGIDADPLTAVLRMVAKTGVSLPLGLDRA